MKRTKRSARKRGAEVEKKTVFLKVAHWSDGEGFAPSCVCRKVSDARKAAPPDRMGSVRK